MASEGSSTRQSYPSFQSYLLFDLLEPRDLRCATNSLPTADAPCGEILSRSAAAPFQRASQVCARSD
jgi:hypothetical protein